MKAFFERKEHFNLIAKHVSYFKGFAPMFHSHCELIHVVDGEIQLTVDGIPHRLCSGETCLVFPYTVHQYEDAPQTDAYIFLFDTDMSGTFENALYTYRPSYPYTNALRHTLPTFQRIIELYNMDTPLATQTAVSYLGALVGEVLSVLDLHETKEDNTDMTKQVLSYCAEHYSDEDISIQKIAEALYISTSYVSKIFNQKLHYSFREYINILRVNHAKKLLKEMDYRIVDVMTECGFKNQSSFNRVFFDACQMSPKQYRKSKRPQANICS